MTINSIEMTIVVLMTTNDIKEHPQKKNDENKFYRRMIKTKLNDRKSRSFRILL